MIRYKVIPKLLLATTLAIASLFQIDSATASTEDKARMAQAKEEQQEAIRQEMESARMAAEEARKEAREAMKQLREARQKMRVVRREIAEDAYIGIVLSDHDKESVHISAVSIDSPAEKAGLKAGDILYKVDGKDISSDNKRMNLRKAYKMFSGLEEGQKLTLGIKRDSKKQSIEVTATRRPERELAYEKIIVHSMDEPGIPRNRNTAPPGVNFDIDIPEIHIRRFEGEEDAIHHFPAPKRIFEHIMDFGHPLARYGLELAPVNDQLGKYFKTKAGVLVINVDDDNPLQLKPGDVILKIGSRDTTRPEQVMRILGSYAEGETMQLEIKRQGKNRTLAITLTEDLLSQLGKRPKKHKALAFQLQ